MKIGIIGSGNYGTALAKTFSKNKDNEIIIYSIDEETINNINKFNENKKYLPKIRLSKNIKATLDMSILSECDIILFAVPSTVYYSVCEKLKNFYNNQIIISASKGIGKNGEILTDIIENILNCDKRKVLVLTGPSIASELALEKPTQVILGGDRKYTQIVKKVFLTDYFFIRITRDKKGIQYLGFYKNILAILVGLCDGLKLGNNMKAALITKAYSEFYYLNQNKNIRRHSFIDYAGLGDLYLTSTSEDSRNRKFGLALSKSNSIKKIIKEMGQVVEGYDNLLRLKNLYDLNKDCSWFEKNLLNTFVAIFDTNNFNIKKSILLKYLHSSEVKALVFDWGNVITTDYYSLHVANSLSKKYNLDVKKLLIDLEKNEIDALLGKENLKEFFIKINKIYPKIKFNEFKKSYYDSISWNDELLKLCGKLMKHYDLYILSNNYNWVVPLIKPKLKQYFKGMVFSNEVKMIKPNNDIFNFLLKKYNLRPENCIYIDDSHKNILAGERNKFIGVEFRSINDLTYTLSEKIFGFKL
jgi:glycerol-3-phosphate dehydrogenase (NAD(P)+)